MLLCHYMTVDAFGKQFCVPLILFVTQINFMRSVEGENEFWILRFWMILDDN